MTNLDLNKEANRVDPDLGPHCHKGFLNISAVDKCGSRRGGGAGGPDPLEIRTSYMGFYRE